MVNLFFPPGSVPNPKINLFEKYSGQRMKIPLLLVVSVIFFILVTGCVTQPSPPGSQVTTIATNQPVVTGVPSPEPTSTITAMPTPTTTSIPTLTGNQTPLTPCPNGDEVNGTCPLVIVR
jgi:hypothetical protein